jgi:hypothetical protein
MSNMSNRLGQTPLLNDTIQAILKCISTPSIPLGPELSQDLLQINLEARCLFEKSGLQQTTQKLLPTQAQNLASPNSFELLQSMMNNLNINNINNTNNMNFNNNNNININSPSKIYTPPIGVQNNQVNLNQSVSLPGIIIFPKILNFFFFLLKLIKNYF